MAVLWGTGHALPAQIISNDEMAKIVDTSDEWIQSHTGVKARHFVDGETSLSLSLEAARKAMEAAGVKGEDLGMIVCGTLSTDHITPSLACELLRELGANCPAFDVNGACTGFLYASAIARAMMGDKPVLVLGCEILSRYTNFADRSTCVLFGDGAGAAVYGPDKGEHGGGEVLAVRLSAYPDAKKSLYITGANGGSDVRGYYFENRLATEAPRSVLYMDGPEVYRFATRAMARELEECCAEAGYTPEDVRYFVPHQANVRIIETAAKLLKLPMERFFVNIDELGNTSAASTIIALDELIRSGKLQKGDLVALVAFGGGMTSGAMLLRM